MCERDCARHLAAVQMKIRETSFAGSVLWSALPRLVSTCFSILVSTPSNYVWPVSIVTRDGCPQQAASSGFTTTERMNLSGLKRTPFDSWQRTPAAHFRLYFFAAISHLLRQLEPGNETEGLTADFPFLAGYGGELARHEPRNLDGPS